MPLNPLSLDVTYGVAGRRFQATVQGLSSGSALEVLTDGTPGFSTVNGRVFMDRLPGAYPIATVVLRETKAGETPRDSRVDIAVAQGFKTGATARGLVDPGRALVRTSSVDRGFFFQDDLGANRAAELVVDDQFGGLITDDSAQTYMVEVL